MQETIFPRCRLFFTTFSVNSHKTGLNIILSSSSFCAMDNIFCRTRQCSITAGHKGATPISIPRFFSLGHFSLPPLRILQAAQVLATMSKSSAFGRSWVPWFVFIAHNAFLTHKLIITGITSLKNTFPQLSIVVLSYTIPALS